MRKSVTPWWSYALAAVIVASLLTPLEAADGPLLMAAWVWPLLLWSPMGNREIGQFRIDVTTTDCVVTLRGCVESRDQAKKAKELAKRLVKVKVKNELTVCTIAPRKTTTRPRKP